MPREITFSISTEYKNGYYNPTFLFGDCINAFNYLGIKKDLIFKRVNANARIQVIQANTVGGPNWMAWTRGFAMRVSPVMNFGLNRYVCAKVDDHEFGHMVRPGHSAKPGLMDPNASMPLGNIVQSDYPWFDAYGWKPGVTQWHLEPGAMQKYFSTAMIRQEQSEFYHPDFEIQYQQMRNNVLGPRFNTSLEHDPLIFGHISSWMDWLPRTLMKP